MSQSTLKESSDLTGGHSTMADSTPKGPLKSGGWGGIYDTKSAVQQFSALGAFSNQLSPFNHGPRTPQSLPKKEAYDYARLPQKPEMKKVTILKREIQPKIEDIARINAEIAPFLASSSAPSSPLKKIIQSANLYLEGERALTAEAIDHIVGEIRLFNPSPQSFHPEVFSVDLDYLAGEMGHTADAITHAEIERSLFQPVQENIVIVKLPWSTSSIPVRKVSKLLTYAEVASNEKETVCVKERAKEQVQDEIKEQVHAEEKKKAKKDVKDTPKNTRKKSLNKKNKHVRFAIDNPQA